MGPLGTTEILLIVAVLFLLFGATKLPQLAKSLGQSKRAFKEGLREAEEEEKADAEAKKLSSNAATPQITDMSDEALMEEMRRRAEAKQT